MDDKKLLNGKFTFKSCVVQKKRTSLLSENVNSRAANIVFQKVVTSRAERGGNVLGRGLRAPEARDFT